MRNRTRGRRPKLSPFVPLTWDLLNSKAYRKLPYSAAKVLPLFLGKPKTHLSSGQAYEVEFPFPYGEAARFGLAPATFSKALKDLVRLGFIEPVLRGGGSGLYGQGQQRSLFRLSRRWESYGTQSFEEVSLDGCTPKT